MKLLILLVLLTSTVLYAEETPEVGIVEKLGDTVSSDLMFTDSNGEPVNFRGIINKPTVLSLVYFDCPGICGPLLNGLQDLINRSQLVPGEDYDLISLSFDHTEKPFQAKKWKNEYISGLEKEVNRNSWSFLTGDSANIKRLTDELGFYYQIQRIDSNRVDYLHAGALIVLSPNGMITRYLRTDNYIFNPFNLKMSILEASKENPQETISKVLLLCYKYDSEGKVYAFDFLFIAGVIITLILAIFFIWLVISGNKKNKNKTTTRLNNV